MLSATAVWWGVGIGKRWVSQMDESDGKPVWVCDCGVCRLRQHAILEVGFSAKSIHEKAVRRRLEKGGERQKEGRLSTMLESSDRAPLEIRLMQLGLVDERPFRVPVWRGWCCYKRFGCKRPFPEWTAARLMAQRTRVGSNGRWGRAKGWADGNVPVVMPQA